MDYDVIYAETLTLSGAIMRVKEEVKEKIAHGWKLQGGISISQDGETGYYCACQALYKTND